MKHSKTGKNKKKKFSDLEWRIISFLKKHLPRPRFLHSLGVMRTAERIAKKNEESPARARIAGLLHDCTRGYTLKKNARLAQEYNRRIVSDAVLVKNPCIVHGFASAAFARKHFHVRDKKVLQAMARHTIAGPRMTLLDKIIYLADITAPDRRFKELKKLRRILQRDIDDAMRTALQIKITFVLQRKQMLHGDAVCAWNELMKK